MLMINILIYDDNQKDIGSTFTMHRNVFYQSKFTISNSYL